MKAFKYLFTVLIVSCSLGFAQQIPAPAQTETFSIVGATAHIGNGTILENSIIVIKNGKISACAEDIAPEGNVIDAKGKHVYPGFIAPYTTLGLAEIGAVAASNDVQELGVFKPHVRSLIAYNAESKIVESMRPNGILIGQITPRGGTITGTSSIVQFDAWNWEDAALKVDDGIHINWPSTFSRGRWWLGEDPGLKPNPNYSKQVNELHNYLAASKAYANGSKGVTNLPYDAMQGLFDGSKRLFINVDDEKGITDAINFANENGVKHMVIVGGYQAHKVANLLKAHNVSVLAQRVHSRPSSNDDDYDFPYKLAKILADQGILVGIQNSGQMERANARNLPFQAGTVAAHGMDKEDALKLITANTAKILGIDDRLGTLEVGKDATLFISEGDALDMRTNVLTHAFINGRNLSLESHHTKLYRRYNKKINGSE